MAGRVRSFSDVELEVLRDAARALKRERKWNGTLLGEAMGVAQQNANRFVADGSRAGIDRTTGNALAIASGYRDVEHLLLDRGVLAEMRPLTTRTAWMWRDRALSLARAAGYPEAVILAVLHRYDDGQYQARLVRWWMDRFALESIQQGDAVAAIEVPRPRSESKPKPRRKAGGAEG